MSARSVRAGQPSGPARALLRWLMPLALLLMVVELAMLFRLMTDSPAPRGEVAGVTQGAPTAVRPAEPTSTIQPVPAAPPPPSTAAPTITAAPPPVTATLRAVAPLPTVAPATPVPPTPAPPVAQPAPVEVEDGPVAAVARFYQLVDQHQFDAAAQLWSSRMRAEYPPAQNINGRFAQTRDLTLQRADVVRLDAASGRAEVAIELLETTAAGTRRWVGSWYLVRGGSGWLLDQPGLAPG